MKRAEGLRLPLGISARAKFILQANRGDINGRVLHMDMPGQFNFEAGPGWCDTDEGGLHPDQRGLHIHALWTHVDQLRLHFDERGLYLPRA